MSNVDLAGLVLWLGLLSIVAGIYFSLGLGAALLLGGLILIGLAIGLHQERHDTCPVCGNSTWDTSDLTEEETENFTRAVERTKAEYLHWRSDP